MKYNIAGNNYSFNDMQYILYKKIIFFSGAKYKPKDYVKKCVVDVSKEKNIFGNLKCMPPFVLYLPIKELFMPIIYEEKKIESQIMKRIVDYILCFVKINKNNELVLKELLLNFEPSFLSSGIKKYACIIKEDLYGLIIKKKYKRVSVKKIKWELNYDYLLEEAISA